MIFAHIKDDCKKAELVDAIKEAKTPYIYRRLMIVQLSSEGKTVPELSDIFKVTPQTVRKLIHGYNEAEMAGVIPKNKPGRTPRLCWTQEEWLNLIHTPPTEFDKLSTKAYNWTLDLLASYLLIYHQIQMSPSNIWNLLRKHKINMGRSQLRITSPDPEYTLKRQRVEQLKKKRKKEN